MDILTLIEKLGFPIFVCLILLFQYKTSIDKLTEALEKLCSSITEHKDDIKEIVKNTRDIKHDIKQIIEEQKNVCKIE